MARRDFYVVAYDIPDDRRRAKLARLLERYGERVQYSVFEMYLTGEEWVRLWRQVRRLLVEDEDQVRVYRLCNGCRKGVEVWGTGEPTRPPGPVLVI